MENLALKNFYSAHNNVAGIVVLMVDLQSQDPLVISNDQQKPAALVDELVGLDKPVARLVVGQLETKLKIGIKFD